jgi:hypothetical protein
MPPPLTPSATLRLLVIATDVRKRLGFICQAMPAHSFDELVDRIALVQLKFEGLTYRF